MSISMHSLTCHLKNQGFGSWVHCFCVKRSFQEPSTRFPLVLKLRFVRYLFSLQSGGNFVLLWLLVGMCIEEPIWHCGEFTVDDDSDILFATHCDKVTKNESKRIYSMFSCLAILLYWTLLCLVCSNLGYVIHVIPAYVDLTWYSGGGSDMWH